MAETPVFWLGGKPGAQKSKGRERPVAETYEPALREVCLACGFSMEEFVAALGGFGGWLAHLQRDGQRYRVFWSGKDRQLRFERAQSHGGWVELGSIESANDELSAFVDSVRNVLQAGASKV